MPYTHLLVAGMKLGLTFTDVCHMSFSMLRNMFVAEDDFRATRPTKGDEDEVRDATPAEVDAWV